jgi:hypothetical protein
MNLLRDTRKHRKKRSMKHRSVKSKKHRGVKSRNIKNTKNKYSGGYYKPDPKEMPERDYWNLDPKYYVIVNKGTYIGDFETRIKLDEPTRGVITDWFIGGGYNVKLREGPSIDNHIHINRDHLYHEVYLDPEPHKPDTDYQ